MGRILTAARTWFQGKKTILGGGLVIAGAVAGVWFGRLDPTSALTLAGAGLSIAGYGAKANRHQAELLAALQDISRAGADQRAGKLSVAADLEPGVAGISSALISGSAATLHLSADSVSELASAIQHLAGNGEAPPPTSNVIPIGGPAK
jgi:hypothetical protein